MTTTLITPSAELVLPADAPRDVWLKARKAGIGGSDALAVLGLSPYSSRYSVWADKSGLLPEQGDSEVMKWGRLLEPIIAEQFTEATGVATSVCGLMRHVDRHWQLASVDRLTEDTGALEIKTTSAYKADDWSDDQIADAAEAQLQHYFAVTGLQHGYAAVLIGGQRLVIRHAERDERLISLLIEAEQELWEMVLTGTAPALDGSEATARALAQIHPWADPEAGVELSDDGMSALREYIALGQEIKALAGRRDTAKNTVCAELGDAMVGHWDGTDVVTWKNTASLDEELLLETAPDLVAEFTTPVPRLDRKALSAAHPDVYQAHRGRRFLPIRKAA